MKAWRSTMAMIWHFIITSKIQGQNYLTTLKKTMQCCTAQRCHHHHLHLFRQCLQMAHLRSHSWLSIAKKRHTQLMNWKNTSNFWQKISTLAIQFNGGWANEVNSRASFSWCTTFYVFLVSISFNSRDTDLNCLWNRFCSCCRKDFLRWVGHHIPPAH